MIYHILHTRHRLPWLIFHLALGFVSIFSPYVLILWFYVVLLSSMGYIFKGPVAGRRLYIACLMTYLASFELLARMARTSPVIPYELSKYLLFVLLWLGIVQSSAKARAGWWMLFLLLPALFIDMSGKVTGYQPLVFNILGPVNTALAIIFFSRLSLRQHSFRSVLLLLLYPPVAVLAYTYFKMPDYDEIQFSLSANFATAGGFGSNQVSTVLGLGTFLVFVFWINRWFLTGYRPADLFLLFGFVFQGLLTFSRGGMIGVVLAVSAVLLVLWRASPYYRRKFQLPSVYKYLLPGILLSIGVFFIVNRITGGLLGLRYQGETAGTFGGYRTKTLNVVTSNRYDILLGDLALWAENPILGVGVGASRHIRETVSGVVAHVEFSRLLAEHGLLGLIYFLLLLTVPLAAMRRTRDPALRGIQLALFILALFTTFHAAMRTYVTTLLTGISVLAVTTAPPRKKLQETPSP